MAVRTRARNRRPLIIYGDNIPAPYIVERFNTVIRRGNVDLEAWFGERTDPDRSWTIDESMWQFPHRYLPRVGIGRYRLSLPTTVPTARRPDLLVSLYATPSFLAGLRPALDAGLLRDIFGYGLRGNIGNLTPIDSMQLDLAAVVVLLGAHDAGLYSVAASAALVVRSQAGAVGMVSLPAVAAARSEIERIATAERLFRLGLVLTIGLAVTVVVSAPWAVVLVYGPAFGAAVPLVQILGTGIVAASLRQILGDGLRRLGQPLPGRSPSSQAGSRPWSVSRCSCPR
jgi:hypothetical protein